VNYAKSYKTENLEDFEPFVDLHTIFTDRAITDEKPITENDINEVLELTGKREQESQLNCGACGYASCVDMAKAVIKSLAEPDMCMPYMRRMAEQRSDKIIETSPNGIVLIDDELKIISMNPAFKKLFMCTDSILGRRISYLVDAAGYEKLAANAMESFESVVSYGGKVYHQLIYALRGEKQLVGIYVDITKLRMDEEKMNTIRLRGLEQAKSLLNHQIRMAQDMAKFLGENTARGEELVRRLLSTYENGD
jgi:PAS domain S-box-containing protein